MKFDCIWPIVEPVVGSYQKEELELLAKTAKGCKQVMEIGCMAGRSTLTLALAMEGGTLTVVDPFVFSTSSIEDFYKTMKKCPPQIKWSLLVQLSQDLEYGQIGVQEMIHIDGSHDQEDVLEDLIFCSSMTYTMAIHDYGNKGLPGVEKAVKEFLGNDPLISTPFSAKQWKISELTGTTMVLRRRR